MPEYSTSGQKTELFSVKYNAVIFSESDTPWLEDMKVADDGSAMLLMTQKREDESASELMVFRLTGF